MEVQKGKYKHYLWFLHGFFLLLYGSLSLLNHYYFRSSGLDYGLANQALYLYAHFEPATITQLLGGQPVPYLACHLSFWVPLLSPFYWIFGTYTLLIFQMLSLVFAMKGIQKLAEEANLEVGVIALIFIQFYSSMFVFAAFGFDYHDNVIGASFLPWLIWFFRKGKWVQTVLCFLAILGSKENMAIWAGFVALALPYFSSVRTKKEYIFSLLLFALAVFYFFLAAFYIMPSLHAVSGYLQLNRFSHLGRNLPQIIGHIFQHPWDTFSLFWKSHVQPDADEKVKWEFLWVLLFSGGLTLFRKPIFLWMALPLLIQKLWNKETAFWGISYHYQFELAILISVAFWYWMKTISNKKFRIYLMLFFAICTLSVSYLTFETRFSNYQPEKENVLLMKHYQVGFDVGKVNAKLANIQDTQVVCAQSNIMPHLAFRKQLYHFPFVQDAKYLVFFEPGLNAYPLIDVDAKHVIDSMRMSQLWEEDSSAIPLRILIRKPLK